MHSTHYNKITTPASFSCGAKCPGCNSMQLSVTLTPKPFGHILRLFVIEVKVKGCFYRYHEEN